MTTATPPPYNRRTSPAIRARPHYLPQPAAHHFISTKGASINSPESVPGWMSSSSV